MERLYIVGDAFFDREIEFELDNKTYLLLNLECVLSNEKVGYGKVGLSTTYDWEKNVYPEKTFVSLANNHTLDGGIKGLEDTIRYLEKYKIGYFGAGTEQNNYNNPYILKMNKNNICFLSYNCINSNNNGNGEMGIAHFDMDKVQKDIKSCIEKKHHKVVVCIHWGIEEALSYTNKQQQIAHMLIDYGADCVVGHHPHCTQPYEKYRGKYIFYSMGNFFFPNFKAKAFKSEENEEGIIYRKRQLWWNKKSILATIEDGNFNEIETVILKQRGNKIVKAGIFINKYIFFARIRTVIRKVLSMVISNIFTDGKLIDISYFSNELKLFRNRHKGE